MEVIRLSKTFHPGLVASIPLIVLICSVLTGCSRSTSQRASSVSYANPRPATVQPNPLPKWAKVFDDGVRAIVVLGVAVNEYSIDKPVAILDMRTGKAKVSREPSFIVVDLAVRRNVGTVAVSAQTGPPSNGALSRSGVWINASQGLNLKQLIPPTDSDVLMGLVWSPDANHLAGWNYSSVDQEKYLNWFIDHKMGKARSKSPSIEPKVMVFDRSTGKVCPINVNGFPIGWDAEGVILYINSGNVTAYNLVTGNSTIVSVRQDIMHLEYSAASDQFIAITAVVTDNEDATSIEVVDRRFQTTRSLGIVKSLEQYELSPDGSKLAYLADAAYYVMNVESGKTYRLPSISGDLGPSWASDDSLLVGNTASNLLLVSLNGKVIKHYDLKEILRHAN